MRRELLCMEPAMPSRLEVRARARQEGGAHASHVVVPQEQIRAAPDEVDLQTLAVLPYSFSTMWHALRSSGLTAANAAGLRVLVNGASGALGQLSLQLLRAWGGD